MGMTAGSVGVTVEQWFEHEPPPGFRYEVAGGELVVTPIGQNPHQRVANSLVLAFHRQWPDCEAISPGSWVLESGPDGRVATGRYPDVLVAHESLVESETFDGVPLAVVEVWSPSNRRAERERKRREYRAAGAPVLVEVWIYPGEVRVEWSVPLGPRWVLRASATGAEELVVEGERPFRVVPDDLLLRPR